MINTLKTIMLLRMTVKTNSMISWLRRIPLVNKIITDDFYKYSGIKTLVTIVTWLRFPVHMESTVSVYNVRCLICLRGV